MKKILPILRLIWLPLVIIFIDVFFNGLPVFSIIGTLVMIFYMIPKTILLGIKKNDKFRVNLTHTLIFIGTVILVFFATWLDGKIAGTRAQKMVDVIEQYNLKYQHYPDRLEDLVPEFISGIPAPKLFLLGSKFNYFVNEGKATHELVYVVIPPFGRRGYLFEKKEWHEFD